VSGKTASDKTGIRQTWFQLIEQSWHVEGHATNHGTISWHRIKFSDLEKLFGDISQEQSLPSNIDQDRSAEVLLPIAAVAVGMTVLELVFHIASGGAIGSCLVGKRTEETDHALRA
jgi:hypothetical protein